MTNNTTFFSEQDYNKNINKKEMEITKMNGLFFFILGIMVFDYVSSHRMNKQKKFEKRKIKWNYIFV